MINERWKIVALIIVFGFVAGSGYEPKYWIGAPKFFALVIIGVVLFSEIYE